MTTVYTLKALNVKYSLSSMVRDGKSKTVEIKKLYKPNRNIDNKYVYSSNNYLIPINIINPIVNNSELNTKISANLLHN